MNEREEVREVHIEIDESVEGEVSARVVKPPYTVTVDLKHPIQYGSYKQSYFRIGISDMDMVSAGETLKIWTSDRYVYIPYSNIIMWTITDNHKTD
jgi:hypothetical protein